MVYATPRQSRDSQCVLLFLVGVLAVFLLDLAQVKSSCLCYRHTG